MKACLVSLVYRILALGTLNVSVAVMLRPTVWLALTSTVLVAGSKVNSNELTELFTFLDKMNDIG